ncbi:MFS transporter [Lichenicoccus roseus]|uniref:MFS transporter n=1 Tax=Lichenicoccus roseus TaxID=2683649 RepID=A0A5R9J7W9_9PROT|nr:MFS transporter [Lichenicoccus roseus]TLU73710.1 MFS transporter [Lichenicoccus roseus]
MTARQLRRIRIVTLGLLMIAGCVNYLDRSAVAIANAPIRQSLGLSRAQMGVLLSAFSWSYGLSQIPVGVLIDRYGPRWLLTLGLCVWSCAQAAAGFAGGLGSFVTARLALGVGESPLYLAGTKACTAWWGPGSRALPIGIFNASSALGPAIAPPILTVLILGLGWRAAFVVIGALGLLVAVAWHALYRDPHADHQPDQPQDRMPERTVATTGPGDGWRALLRTRTSWSMATGFFGVIYLTWLYGAWLPDYLHSVLHLSLHQVGIWAAVPQLCGFGGALLGGAVSHALGRRGVAPVAACVRPLVAGLLLAAAATAALALCRSAWPAILLSSLALFCANLASSCGWALAAVATGPASVATLEAIQNVGGSLGGALAPMLTGLLIDETQSFSAALFTGAAVAVASALIYATGMRAR